MRAPRPRAQAVRRPGACATPPRVPSQGPTVTAAVVASTLLLLRDDPELAPLAEGLALSSVERAVRAALPPLGWLLDHAPWWLLRRASSAVERAVSPDFVAHYALRKHEVRTQLLRALEEGFGQVVLLGAGFDALSASLPAETVVVEVDHPATQRLRREALDEEQAPRPHLVALDLAKESLREGLLGCAAFDAAAPTVYVAEGVLMYLPEARVRALLEDLAAGGGAVRLLCTVVTPDPEGRLRLHSQRAFVDWCMRQLEETFAWGVSAEELGPFLAGHGFALQRFTHTAEVADRLLGPTARRHPRGATGELVVIANAPLGRA